MSEADEHVTAMTVREWRHQWAQLSLSEKDRYQPYGVGGEDEYIAERVREVIDAHRQRT